MKGSLRRTLLLVRKDLLRRRRAPLAVLVMLAFPLLFAGMLALAFGGDGDSATPRAKLLLEDRDDAFIGGTVKSFLGAEQVQDFLEMVEVEEGKGRAMIENGEASALLVIPKNATTDIWQGDGATFLLVRNPAQSILPEIAEETTRILADVLGAAARLLRAQAEELGIENVSSLDQLSDQDFAALAVKGKHLFELAERYADGPPLDLDVVELPDPDAPAAEAPEGDENGEGDDEEDGDDDDVSIATLIFLMVLPGVSVYSLFVIGDQTMRDLLAEGTAGTLRRQLAAPLSAAEIVGSKLIGTAIVASFALLVLASIAWGLVTEPVHPAAFLLVACALVLAIAGFASFVYGLASNETQGATVSSVIYLVMAFSGGAFIPLNSLPESLRTIAPVSLFYWGTEGFRELLEGGAVADVFKYAAVLATIGLVSLPLGTWLLHRKMRRGGLGG